VIKKIFSIINAFIFVIFIIIVGGFVVFYLNRKEDFRYKEPEIQHNDNVLGESTIMLDERIEIMEKNLNDNQQATLILTELEAKEFIKSSITNSFMKWLPVKTDEFYLDFSLNKAYFHSSGLFGIDVVSEIISMETEAGTYYPKVEKVSIGPIKLPDFVSEKADSAVFQAVEQMKTQSYGNRKITKLRFMQDKVVLEFELI